MNGLIGKEYLKEYQTAIQPELQKYFQQKITEGYALGQIPGEITERFYEITLKGKMLRGALTVLGYLVAGGKNVDAIYDASTFIELFHAGVLVHDDFMDNDPFRRGMPTLHKQFAQRGQELDVKSDYTHYGNAMAVCAGDLAYYFSWEKLLSAKVDPTLLIEVGKLYAHYIIRLVHGQELDITITGAKDLTEKDVLHVIWTKSGEYTSLLPLKVGALLAGCQDKVQLEALENYARCFGWAFHIQDDVLGLFGEEETMGKPVGSDIREGKNTLFMLYLEKHGSTEQLAFKRYAVGNPDISPDDVVKMKQIVRDVGAYDHVVSLGWGYVEEGKQYISQITQDQKLQEILESLLIYMMERVK